MFFYEICEIVMNTYFKEHLFYRPPREAPSEITFQKFIVNFLIFCCESKSRELFRQICMELVKTR